MSVDAQISLEAALFDIDGTLVDTGGAGVASWERAFEHLTGHGVDVAAITSAGMTDPEIARRVFEAVEGRAPTKREIGRLVNRYLALLPELVAAAEDYRVLPGARETLERLSVEGVLLGVTSGTVEAAAHIKLARGRLNHFFCFGGYGSDSPDRTQLTRRGFERGEGVAGHPLERARTVVVGDTPRDVAAAHGAGIQAVGVATGRYSVAELRDAGADFALADLTAPFPEPGG